MKLVNHNAYDIVLLGCGANGSHFLRGLLQDLANYRGIDTRILIADGDKVEHKNIKNQLFDIEDVGSYKVHALSERYGEHYKIDILAYSNYITTFEELDSLFANNFNAQRVLIGCLDNNRTRQLLHEYFERSSDLIYIDVGVEGVILKEELEKEEFEHYSYAQKNRMIVGSGFSGQVVVGVKYKGYELLKPIGGVYPNILTDRESVFPTQTCAETVNNPQRLETNKLAAQFVNIVMNNLFHTGELFQHEIEFHARYGTANSTLISRETIKLFEEINAQTSIKNRGIM